MVNPPLYHQTTRKFLSTTEDNTKVLSSVVASKIYENWVSMSKDKVSSKNEVGPFFYLSRPLCLDPWNALHRCRSSTV